MKNTARIALALCALGLAVPAAAADQGRRQFGLGVSIASQQSDANLPTVEVYVPIRLAPQFRIEPSLGILTRDPTGPNNSHRDLTLGIGAFWMKQLAPAADLYAGGRLKLNFAKQETGGAAGNVSDTDLVIAAALGGEYYLATQLSLGLEAQLGMYQLGDASGNVDGFFTNGLAFLRLYF
jgi:hypothetical protein